MLDANPFHTRARHAVVQSLRRRGQRGDAAVATKRQIDLLGPMPGVCYAYGRSFFESGNYSGPCPLLRRRYAWRTATLTSSTREELEKALDLLTLFPRIRRMGF